MAGLLDIFGSSGTDSLGLLGMSQEDIKRARDDAQAQAMYALAGRLFQGGNTGQSIAQGLQMGQQAYKQAMNEQLGDKLQTVKLQELMRQQQEAQEIKRRQAAVENIIGQAYRPAQAAIPAQTPTGPLSGAAFGEGRAATPARFDIQGAAPMLMALPEGRKALTDILSAQKAMAGESFKLGEGERQFTRDPFTGELKQVATGGEKAKNLKEVDLGSHIAMLDPTTGSEVMRFPKGRAPEGPVSLQHVETDQGIATFNPRTGQLTPIMQGGKPVMGKGAGQLTEAQGNATTFGMRMAEANKTLTDLENSGLKDTGMLRSGVSGTVGAIPLIGESMSKGVDNIFNVLPSVMGGLNEAQQSTLQARVNFITAVLRKESGASISPSEFATAEKNYFPAPGDSEKTIAQKQKAREMAIKGMKLQAGPGAKYISQDTGVTSSGW